MRMILPAVLLVTSVAAGAQVPATADLQKLGPQTGERAPGFSLKDQAGRTRTLASIMGRRGAMIVFFRSADW